MRTCPRCRTEKELSCFGKNKNNPNGLQTYCKTCCHEYAKGYFKKHRDRVLAAMRDYQKISYRTHPELHAERTRRYLERIKGNPPRASVRFATYKQVAKRDSKDFQISREQFMSFWQQPCYYCGMSIQTIGLDRVNNERGYCMDNIVPCCKTCNRAKNDLTRAEFLAMCYRIVGINESRNTNQETLNSKEVQEVKL